MTDRDRVVVLTDWPEPAAGAPEPEIRADESTLLLRYATSDERFAVIRFPLVRQVVFGAPNDEARPRRTRSGSVVDNGRRPQSGGGA